MAVSSFIEKLKHSVDSGKFIKLSLGNYKGSDKSLKQILVKLVLIKRTPHLSFTFRHKTKDIVKNFLIVGGIKEISEYLEAEQFRIATLFNDDANIVFQTNNHGKWGERMEKPSAKRSQNLSHDVVKQRKVGNTQKSYLHALRLTDEKGDVYKSAQDKWRQINHYLELLSVPLNGLDTSKTLQVVDMGAGKGYLTFALYDYLANELKRKCHVEGVEYREDLVILCNDIAKKSAFEGLKFSQGTIEDYESQNELDMLIALHACDTATDDAIYKGIMYKAKLIVVAPCCHKQIRKELEFVKAKNDLDFMIRHGVFLERHAEMLTDSIRSLILEYFGYQTKVIQFISDAHTPKNVMIVAERRGIDPKSQDRILKKIETIKSYFGIRLHHLEKLCNLNQLIVSK